MERIAVSKLEQIFTTNNKVVVMVVADWCGQCKMLKLIIEKHLSNFPNLHFIEIDGESENLWEHNKYKISQVPTLFFVENEEIINTIEGYQYEGEMLELLNSFDNKI